MTEETKRPRAKPSPGRLTNWLSSIHTDLMIKLGGNLEILFQLPGAPSLNPNIPLWSKFGRRSPLNDIHISLMPKILAIHTADPKAASLQRTYTSRCVKINSRRSVRTIDSCLHCSPSTPLPHPRKQFSKLT